MNTLDVLGLFFGAKFQLVIAIYAAYDIDTNLHKRSLRYSDFEKFVILNYVC